MASGLSLSSSSSLSDMSNIVIASAIANIEPAGPTNQLVARYDKLIFQFGVETMQQHLLKV